MTINYTDVTAYPVSTPLLTSTTTLTTNRSYRVDSTGGIFTLTLPNIVSDMDFIRIIDWGGSVAGNNVTVSSHVSDSIFGNATYTMDENNATWEFFGNLTTNTWAVRLSSPTLGAGSSVTSVFGRTGVVVAAVSDYDANQVDFTPVGNIAATDAQAAIAEVANEAPFTFNTTAAPSANDDAANTSGNGIFKVGDIWVDTASDEIYVCTDPSATSAIWVNVSSGTSSVNNFFGGTAPPTANDDAANTSGNGIFSAGSRWVDITNDESYVLVDATATAAVWVQTSVDIASEVTFVPSGNIAATNVQTAIDEVVSESPFTFNTTADPSANDDAADTAGNGTFKVGDIWVNTTSDEAFVCVDSTATAAVWTSITVENEMSDADGDTYIRVEEGADDDTIRMRVGDNSGNYTVGVDVLTLNTNGFNITTPDHTAGVGVPLNLSIGTATTVGGAVNITAGATVAATGGAVNVTGGSGGTTGIGGSINLIASDGGSTSGNGGSINIVAGGVTSGTVGHVEFANVTDGGTNPPVEVRFMEANGGANYVGLEAPADVTSDVVWMIPNIAAEVAVSFSAVLGNMHPVDCSGGAITVTVPATPVAGSWFSIIDSRSASATNNITIDFVSAGDNLHGIIQNYIININSSTVKFVYVDAAIGWVNV